MGQNISCLTQLNEEISETSQLLSVPNPLLRRQSGSDGSKGTVARARVPKSDWDSTNEDGFWLFLNIAYYKMMHSGKLWPVLAVVNESASVSGICKSYLRMREQPHREL